MEELLAAPPKHKRRMAAATASLDEEEGWQAMEGTESKPAELVFPQAHARSLAFRFDRLGDERVRGCVEDVL